MLPGRGVKHELNICTVCVKISRFSLRKRFIVLEILSVWRFGGSDVELIKILLHTKHVASSSLLVSDRVEGTLGQVCCGVKVD